MGVYVKKELKERMIRFLQRSLNATDKDNDDRRYVINTILRKLRAAPILRVSDMSAKEKVLLNQMLDRFIAGYTNATEEYSRRDDAKEYLKRSEKMLDLSAKFKEESKKCL